MLPQCYRRCYRRKPLLGNKISTICWFNVTWQHLSPTSPPVSPVALTALTRPRCGVVCACEPVSFQHCYFVTNHRKPLQLKGLANNIPVLPACYGKN
jgi:hypothetical protein